MRDEFGIGLRKVAAIQADLAMKQMGSVWARAFGTMYAEAADRASLRAIFYAARADYEQAKEALQ